MPAVASPSGPSLWTRALFPDSPRRDAFLAAVRLWNRSSGAARIEVEPLAGGVGVKVDVEEGQRERLLHLIAAYEGTVTFEIGSGRRALWRGAADPCAAARS